MKERSNQRRRGLVQVLAIGFTVAALVKELRLPREERTWHGTVGVVPYDFRRPTADRIRERLWSPSSPRVFVPTVFGVGWTINVGRIVELVRGAVRD